MTYSNIRKYVENGVTINDFHARGGVITRKQFISTIERYTRAEGWKLEMVRKVKDSKPQWIEKLLKSGHKNYKFSEHISYEGWNLIQ